MSDLNLDPLEGPSSGFLPSYPEVGRRRSARLARGGSPPDEAGILSQLRDSGITPATGLPLSQVHELAEYACSDPVELPLCYSFS